MSGADIGQVMNDFPFEGALMGYSVMNAPYREKALETAAELNRGIVAMNPLGGGIIPQNPERFDFIRTKDDETVVQGALRFLLSDPRITIALVGISNIEQLQEAVAVTEDFTPLTDEEKARIRSELKVSFDSLCTSCCYCDSCPEGIPVPKLLDAYNHYALTGEPESIVNRMRYHWGISPEETVTFNCTKCRKCEKLCTQKLPICDRIDVVVDAAKAKIAENQ